MAFKFHHTSHVTKTIIIAEFCFLSYLLYTLTFSVYKIYQIDVHIKNFEAENTRIEMENQKISQDIEYFTSSSYVEKIAKQNLGLVKPGEEVIIIPQDEFSKEVDDVEGGSNNRVRFVANTTKWWSFVFGPKYVSRK